MKCLVTGASGSVGSRIVRRLLEDSHEVRALVRTTSSLDYLDTNRVEIVYGDMTDADSLRAAASGVEWIFHAAAPVDDWLPEEVFRAVNVEGTDFLIEACDRKTLKRLVFVSSVNVYGVQPPAYTNEETPHNPGSIPYCVTKAIAEKRFLRAHREEGLPVTILRPANIWGPTANAWMIRPIAELAKDKAPLIAGGSGAFNSTYVDNLADLCVLAATVPEADGEVFISTDGIDGMTFKDYFGALCEMLGRPPVTKSIPKPVALVAAGFLEILANITGKRPRSTRFVIQMLTKRCHYDISKARDMLGYKPRYTFEEGLAESKRWLAERGLLG